MKFSYTGIYILPAEDTSHNHSVLDPGHRHEPDELAKTWLQIMPALDGHTHEVIDPGHPYHIERAVTKVRLSVVNGHTHELAEYGHTHGNEDCR